jgi:hypothetical protein
MVDLPPHPVSSPLHPTPPLPESSQPLLKSVYTQLNNFKEKEKKRRIKREKRTMISRK